MDFFDFCLACALPSNKDFLILKKEHQSTQKYIKSPKPLKGLSKGFYNRLRSLKLADLEKEYIKAKKFSLIRLDSKNYPRFLKEISDPPAYIFVWGNKNILSSPSLAFVGSRRATQYGKKVCFNLIFNLELNWTIVSGLAIGIDGFAHQAALESDKKTIAVLGSGFLNLYPSVHQPLAEKIIKDKGVVISEYPPQFKPEAYYFPARNRIISGLSLGVIIVEASRCSGSLITAALSAKYGREVFAVPNDIFSLTSQGCFSLIKQGAIPVFSASDIEEQFLAFGAKWLKQIKPKKTKKPDLIIDFLKVPKHLDQIQKFLKLTSEQTLAKLSELEIEGKIKNIGSGFYQVI